MRMRTRITQSDSVRMSAPIAALLVFALIFSLCTSVFAEKSNGYAVTPDDLQVIGSDLSAMSAVDINGSSVTGSVFSQKRLTVLHYFATWSPDCIRELSYMQNALNHFGSGQIAVYGLLYEDAASTPASCAALFEQYSITYRCLRLDSVLASLVSIYPLIPQTFFVNSDGIVSAHFQGAFESSAQLNAMISHQLGNPSVFHSVRFIDGLTGGLIHEAHVQHGANAAPPTPPVHSGYEFSHWSGNYQNVTEDRTVTAIYAQLGSQPLLGDVDRDGIITMADAILVLRHSIGLEWSENAFLYGDVDGDGVPTAVDAMLILRHAVGIGTL